MSFCEYGDSHWEGDDKWLTGVKRKQYLLHVKDTLVDFEKEQANVATKQHSHPQSEKGMFISCNNLFSIHYMHKYKLKNR